VSDSFEGDIVRPLGLVTLHFAYAETEIDELLTSMSVLDSFDDTKRQWPVGRKLSHAKMLIDSLSSESLAELKRVLDDAVILFDRRNSLVHGPIYTSTKLVSSRVTGLEQHVTPDDLSELAKKIWSCKEQINAKRQRVLDPILARLSKS
jgi:hypothetical protein